MKTQTSNSSKLAAKGRAGTAAATVEVTATQTAGALLFWQQKAAQEQPQQRWK
jgi:hypothetical protein